MRRSVIISTVVVALGGIIVAVVVYRLPTTAPTVQLLPKEVRVTRCEASGDLIGAADVVNPTHHRANLVFALEFYSKKQNVGLVNYVVPKVAPGNHVLVTDTGSPDEPYVNSFNSLVPIRLTCSVVAFGDGGIIQRR